MEPHDAHRGELAARSEEETKAAFDYDRIPRGYYDAILRNGSPVRRLWHLSKFERVLDYLPDRPDQSILDIGCFAGSFLSLCPEDRFSRQVGTDILEDQIAYANASYGTAFRTFRHVKSISEIRQGDETFDCVSLIEVIEHLRPTEIRTLFEQIVECLKPGGKLILTTPNYASAWPLLEVLVNAISDVKYEEQHITKFTYFNFERKLRAIFPDLWLYFNTLDFKTTTHLITPFLAGVSFDAARKLSRIVPHQSWRQPFGNLILTVLTRGPFRSST